MLREEWKRGVSIEEGIQRRKLYLEVYYRSEVDDTRENIDRISMELRWLEQIASSDPLRALQSTAVDACFESLRSLDGG